MDGAVREREHVLAERDAQVGIAVEAVGQPGHVVLRLRVADLMACRA